MGLIDEMEEIVNEYLPEYKDEKGTLSFLKPIDSGAIDLLRDIASSPLRYNPLHIEPLLDEINAHLNKCLELQSIGQNIEQQAILDILNYDNTLKEISLREQAIVNLENYRGNSHAISKQIELRVENDKIKGDTTSVSVVSDFESNQIELEKELLENRKQINSKINDLRGLKGSAFDLSQRFEYAKEIFEIEFKELYSKLKSVEKGVLEVYEIEDFDLPEITDTGYLVELYKYVRKLNNKLDEVLQYEQEFLVSIALKEGYFKNREHTKVYEDINVWENQVRAGTLIFTIPEKVFENLSNVKLRGIKMSVRWDNERQTSDRWNFTIKVPIQRDSEGNLLWEIPEYHSVGLVANNPGYIYSTSRDLSIYNVSPFGEWTIKLPLKSNRSADLMSEGISDIWLELLISARTQ